MSIQDELDAIAWRTLDAHVPGGPRPEGRCGGSVHNYRDLWEQAQMSGFEHAWSNFLHGFFAWKDEGAFAVPPPLGLGREWCAVLAGAASICARGTSCPFRVGLRSRSSFWTGDGSSSRWWTSGCHGPISKAQQKRNGVGYPKSSDDVESTLKLET
jgi:hypothetical protein